MSKVSQNAPVIWCSRPPVPCIKVTDCCYLSDVKACFPAQLPSASIFTGAETWMTLVVIDRKCWFISPPRMLMGIHSSFFLSHSRRGEAVLQRQEFILHLSCKFFRTWKLQFLSWRLTVVVYSRWFWQECRNEENSHLKYFVFKNIFIMEWVFFMFLCFFWCCYKILIVMCNL